MVLSDIEPEHQKYKEAEEQKVVDVVLLVGLGCKHEKYL